jgi:hypothetical protein
MFLFSRLLLAHLIADFPLQTDWVYKQKVRGIGGVVLHCGIVSLLNVLLLAPYLAMTTAWEAIVFIFIVHVGLDQSKIKITQRRRSWDNIGYFFLDQGFHYLSILMAVVLFDLNALPSPAPVPSWLAFYNDDRWVWGAIVVVASAFGGKVALYYIQRTLQRRELPFVATPAENLIRGGMAFLVILPGYSYLFALPMALMYRFRGPGGPPDGATFWFNVLFPLLLGGIFQSVF